VKVVEDHAQVVVSEDPGEGVKLDQVEEPAGDEERRDHGRPPPQVGEPVERAEAGVDDVEPLAPKGVGGGVDVGGDEPGV
jgi:hypothetical protein